MILYHCHDARSFRVLWALEELGLPYELRMLPFPPRVHAKSYLQENPLGTIPLMLDGATRMTESAAICHYLCVRHPAMPLTCRVRRQPVRSARVSPLSCCRCGSCHRKSVVCTSACSPAPQDAAPPS